MNESIGVYNNRIAKVLSLLSVIVGVVCFFKCENSTFRLFSLLPFLFGIVSFPITTSTISNTISYNIINFVMFLRYTCTVLFYSLRGTVNIKASIKNETFFLMLYEMLVVCAILTILGTKRRNVAKLSNNNFKFEKVDYILMAAIGVITLGIIIMYPSVRATIFNFSISSKTTMASQDSEALSGPLFVCFKMGISILYGFLLLLFLPKAKKKNKISLIIVIIISVLYIASNWSSGESISRWGLITSLAVVYVILIKNYPNRKRLFTICGCAIFAIIIISTSITKIFLHHGSFGTKAISEIFSGGYFNDYFQGPVSVANGIAAMKENKGNINFVTFLDDTISAYPWINRIFYQPNNLTEYYFGTYLGHTDKILPTITQGFAYFGFLGSPAFSALFTCLAIICEKKARITKNVFLTIAYTQIMIWFSLFMAVNVFIIQRTTMYFVLMIFILGIGGKLRLQIQTG